MRHRKIGAAISIQMIALYCLAGTAEATLIDRGGGLIYDTDLDVTWLQDPNSAGQLTWEGAKDWADSLSYYDSVRDVYWEDWRLPRILPINSLSYDLTFGYEGATDIGFNILSPNSEFAYLYYVSLGNLGAMSTEGVRPQPGWSFNGLKTGPFNGEIRSAYWSESAFIPGVEVAYFGMRNGEQLSDRNPAVSFKFAWAVRDGNVVPEPSTALLLGIGLAGLAARRRVRQKGLGLASHWAADRRELVSKLRPS